MPAILLVLHACLSFSLDGERMRSLGRLLARRIWMRVTSVSSRRHLCLPAQRGSLPLLSGEREHRSSRTPVGPDLIRASSRAHTTAVCTGWLPRIRSGATIGDNSKVPQQPPLYYCLRLTLRSKNSPETRRRPLFPPVPVSTTASRCPPLLLALRPNERPLAVQCNTQGSSTVDPVVSRASSARCASATASSG